MKFSRCSRGIAVIAVVLAVLSLFFDFIPAAIASGALVGFLAVRGALFLSALSSVAVSLGVNRSLSSRLVRQGTAVAVETEVRVRVPPGFIGVISDLLPHEAVPFSGTTTTTVSGETSRLNYTVTPMTTGEHPFGGVTIALSDLFFSGELICRTGNAIMPSLVILPAAEFVLEGHGTAGDLDAATFAPLKSPDVRSFREYLPGDDPRRIDWKLSAKHDTFYVREYMGQAGQGALLVIDLPDTSGPFMEEAFSRLKEMAVGAIATEITSRSGISVLIISGPNVISFSPFEPDLTRLRAMMNQMVPYPRIHHMFRYQSTGSLKRRVSSYLRSSAPFSRTLSGISAAYLPKRPLSVFESQVARVFGSSPATAVHLFTLADHDTSHIRVIAEMAVVRSLRLKLHIPEEARHPSLPMSLAGMAEVV